MTSKIMKSLLALIVLAGILLAGFSFTSQASKSVGEEAAQPTQTSAASADAVSTQTPKTAQLTLPEKTNNVWEMKAFELPDTSGDKHTLSDWKGKVIMLNFWASWCAPCQFEIPRFVRYQNKYADKGLQIVGVGLDDADKLKNVERSLEMNYPTMVIAQDEGTKLLEKWGNDQQIVPYTVVIAEDGKIVYIHRGGMEDEDFEEYVLPLLQ